MNRIRKFISYYKPYLGLFLADMACAIAVSAITLIIPLCTRYITKLLIKENQAGVVNEIYTMGAIMLGLIIIYTLCSFFVGYKGHVMGTYMEADLRNELFRHYEKLSFSFYDEHRTGQLMSRINNDLLSMTELFHHGPEDITLGLIKLIGSLIILFNVNVRLTLVVLLFLPVMIIYALYFNKRMRAAYLVNRARIGDINAQVEDTLSGIRVVKSFANEDIEREKFAYENGRLVESRKDIYKHESFFYEGLVGFTQLITVAVIFFGGIWISGAALDLADLITYLMYIGILMEPVHKLGNFIRLYQEGTTGFQRFMEMMEIKPDIQDADHAIELNHVRGDIEFKNVSFRYKEGCEDVLKNINLRIHGGEYVALIGTSGVGKTTLCSLIPRFYDAYRGEILIDGINVKAISQRSLRSAIGIVQQDVYLFSGTVLENIGYGKPGATREEIVEAAKKANAHDFIMSLPNGYDTDIGQRGVKLSGGQKQRLSIARVFLKNPPILIFDEATSALDNESEKAIKESLEKLAKNRTTLVIAHRLSTIRNAKRILVLTESGIVEQGTHDELIGLGGTYANLYNVQLMI